MKDPIFPLIAFLLLPLVAMAQKSFVRAVFKPVTQRPCLLIDPVNIPAVMRRLESFAGSSPVDVGKTDAALYGLLFGDEAFNRKTTAAFIVDARNRFTVKPGGEYPGYRRYNEMLYRYDLIASFGFLTDEEKNGFRDLMVAGAYHFVGDDPAKFPSKETPHLNGTENPEGNSTSNRWTDQFMVAALVGMNFPELPQSNAWVRYAAQQIQYQLDNGVWDGAWNEVPRFTTGR